ncbi:MAG: hypothetical protein KDA27_22265 [Candidatus Eisenbacteria bacterium]|uniref:FlgD/Vpr Ig-like domain-containing protein n=1 Tax=Eiseniibacteriota bacterium TaxID=2212470 RepID=A0A956NIS5_UNCEI|nr:hypothetical protein [Candidatus Eisenbacteria bacterium]
MKLRSLAPFLSLITVLSTFAARESVATCTDYTQGMQWVQSLLPVAEYAYVCLDWEGDYLVGVGLAGAIGVPTSCLVIYDVSTPTSPTLLSSEFSDALIEDVVIRGTYAALVTGNLTLVSLTGAGGGEVPGVHNVRDITWVGDYLYAGTTGGLVILDLADPEAPSIVGTIPTVGRSNAELIVMGDYLYYMDLDLQIIDIRDPSNPSVAATVPTGLLEHIAFDGETLFASRSSTLYVYDVSDPLSPVSIATMDDPWGDRIDAFQVDGDLLVYGTRLTAVSVEDPFHPHVVGNAGFLASDIAIENETLFAAGERAGIFMVDISDPASQYELEQRMEFEVRDVGDLGDWIAVAGEGRVDIYDAVTLAPVNSLDFEAHVTNVPVLGTLGLVIEEGGTAWPVDFSDVESPIVYPSFELPYGTTDTDVDGGVFYVLSGSGVATVDLSDPTNPVTVGPNSVLSMGWRPSVDGNLCAIWHYNGYSTLWDISDPGDPVLQYVFENLSSDVFLRGSYLYAASAGEIRTYDVTTPTNPVLVHTAPWPSSSGKLEALGGVLYGTSSKGVIAFDLTDPSAPHLVGDLAASGETLFPTGDAIFTNHARQTSRVPIVCDIASIEPGDRGPASVIDVVPNPFFARVRISYQAASTGISSVGVFDSSGRLVRSLFSGVLEAGRHEWEWNGLTELGAVAPTGVYYVRAQGSHGTQAETVVRIR